MDSYILLLQQHYEFWWDERSVGEAAARASHALSSGLLREYGRGEPLPAPSDSKFQTGQGPNSRPGALCAGLLPTVQDFQGNPLQYVEKIRKVAEKYGIARIVPPPGWNPGPYFGECEIYVQGIVWS